MPPTSTLAATPSARCDLSERVGGAARPVCRTLHPCCCAVRAQGPPPDCCPEPADGRMPATLTPSLPPQLSKLSNGVIGAQWHEVPCDDASNDSGSVVMTMINSASANDDEDESPRRKTSSGRRRKSTASSEWGSWWGR
jgi:hypothetical protein